MRRVALAMRGRRGKFTRDPTGQTSPRAYLFDELFAERYDEAVLEAPRSPLDRSLPDWMRLAMAIEKRRDEYDAIVTWSERLTLAMMGLQTFSAGSKPHIAMLYWFSRPSVRLPMRAFGNSLQAIVTWSSVQREYAISRLGIPAEKLYLVRHYADQVFWTPRDRPLDMICSAGSEMRDYVTLLKALRGTSLRCHIATDHVRVDRFGLGRRVRAAAFQHLVDKDVTIGHKSYVELREIYARSAFVVVPLVPSDTDNGVTVILEAMAMGKAVICSRTQGQVDVIQEGVTGLFVPVGDPVALRRAMLDLWNDPERARAMGRAARVYVEKYHALERFCGAVSAAIDASLDGRPAARDGSFDVPSSAAPSPGPP